MRKIISILFALSLVLGLSVIATPVAAAVTTPTVVVFDTDCACDPAAGYNITFNISASLTEGVHSVCIEFPAGTTVPASFATGDIKIGPVAGPMVSVFAGEITVTGQKVCFLVPAHLTTAENPIRVTFGTLADIGNPCTPGTTYSALVQVSTTNTSYIRYRSNDTAGNLETTQTQAIRIDTTAPTASFVPPTPTNLTWQRANFTLNASFADLNLSSCQYQVWNSTINTTPWTSMGACSGLESFTNSTNITVGPSSNCNSQGLNNCTVYIRAIDQAGNNFTNTSVYHIDWITPTVAINSPNTTTPVYRKAGEVVPINYTYTEANPANATLWLINQAGETVNWTVVTGLAVGTDVTRVDTLTIPNGTPDGKYHINVTITDNATNSNSSQQVNATIVDSTAPTTTATAVRSDGSPYTFDTWTNLSYVNVTLSCSDGVGGGCDVTQYCNDTTNSCPPSISYVGPVQISAIDVSYIRYLSNDTVGNLENTKNQTIKINVIAPTSTITAPGAGSWQRQAFNVSVGDSDTGGSGLSVCQYRVVSAGIETLLWTTRTCNSNVSISVGTGQDCRDQGANNCTVYARANDTAGNIGTPDDRNFSIDWTAPNTTITSPTNLTWQRVNFNATIADADAGSGLNTSACYWRILDNNTQTWPIDGVIIPGKSGNWSTRTCNANVTVTVGPSANCSSQGFGRCGVEAFAIDLAGNVGD